MLVGVRGKLGGVGHLAAVEHVVGKVVQHHGVLLVVLVRKRQALHAVLDVLFLRGVGGGKGVKVRKREGAEEGMLVCVVERTAAVLRAASDNRTVRLLMDRMARPTSAAEFCGSSSSARSKARRALGGELGAGVNERMN